MNKIDAFAITLDETDRHTISEADAPWIKQIQGVYLFDRNQRTELTSSYRLTHLYDQVIPVDYEDEYRCAELYDKYEYGPSEDIYVHCHTIDGIIEQGDRDVVYHYGDTEVSFDDVDYCDQMESVREYLCGNCPF